MLDEGQLLKRGRIVGPYGRCVAYGRHTHLPRISGEDEASPPSHRASAATGLGCGARKGPPKGGFWGVMNLFVPKRLEGPAELLFWKKLCGREGRGVSSSSAGAEGGVCGAGVGRVA